MTTTEAAARINAAIVERDGEGWANWNDFCQNKYQIIYDHGISEFSFVVRVSKQHATVLNYCKQKTMSHILQNYLPELKLVFGIGEGEIKNAML